MSGEFLPEYDAMPRGAFHVPLYKLFTGDKWRFVQLNGKPMECVSRQDAKEQAKDCVRRILNPEIRAEQIEAQPAAIEIDADILGIAEWQANRDQQAEAERVKVFGAGPVKSFRNKQGKPVEVVVKRRARV